MENYTHLTTKERELIFLYQSKGLGDREIGKILLRSHRTIGRELQRNTSVNHTGVTEYSPSKAGEEAGKRRAESKARRLTGPSLRSYVIGRLIKGWSPEQIAGRLKLKAPNIPISHETIYQFIYAKESKDLRLWEFLRRGHKRRQKRDFRKAQKVKHLEIPGRVFIDQRSEEANLRSRFGHFETDLLEGKRSDKEAVSVVVDRKTTYLSLDKLPNHESETKSESLIQNLQRFPFFLAKSITFDNGPENRLHQKVAEGLSCLTYFCHPYHSWEKGTVENTISLVRSYIPKGTSLRGITLPDLGSIAVELNTRPRKKLGFYTPLEAVYKEMGWGT